MFAACLKHLYVAKLGIISLSLHQEAIFRIVAAILHLGNIAFTKGEEDSSMLEDDKSKFHLQVTAELLMYGCILGSLMAVVFFSIPYLCIS